MKQKENKTPYEDQYDSFEERHGNSSYFNSQRLEYLQNSKTNKKFINSFNLKNKKSFKINSN